MGKWYVAIDGRNHISRTNLAGCTTECGITMEIGQALTVSTPALVCQRCEEQYKPAAMGGPMSLPHYLEAENKRLRDALAAEIGLLTLLLARDDLKADRHAILTNHRHVEAVATLMECTHD